jgi:sulfate transport system ATP-binding protein
MRVTTVLVTHDQEEAMEVADQIAIIRDGSLEQVGTPAECYDHPVSEFVATFLGTATLHDGDWVRPHDLVITTAPSEGARPGVLGFEVRVEIHLDDGSDTYVQLARRSFEELALATGDRVFVAVAATNPIGRSGRGAS